MNHHQAVKNRCCWSAASAIARRRSSFHRRAASQTQRSGSAEETNSAGIPKNSTSLLRGWHQAFETVCQLCNWLFAALALSARTCGMTGNGNVRATATLPSSSKVSVSTTSARRDLNDPGSTHRSDGGLRPLRARTCRTGCGVGPASQRATAEPPARRDNCVGDVPLTGLARGRLRSTAIPHLRKTSRPPASARPHRARLTHGPRSNCTSSDKGPVGPT